MTQSRRNFLKTSAGAALGAMTTGSISFAAPAKPTRGDTVVVALQLAGGNDGLNTVVPYADDNYAKNRRTLRLSADEVRKIAPGIGLHPAMAGFERLFKEGRLTVVQGVGYPNPDGGHPSSTRIWQTGDREDPRRETGWLGRAADALSAAGADVPAVFVGETPFPFTMHAKTAIVPSIRRTEDLLISDQTPISRDPPAGNSLLAAALEMNRRIDRASKQAPGASYPDIQLASSLRTVAQLIRAEVGIRIYHVELGGAGIGGFDNHAGQRDNHAALLGQLSQSVAAFVDDLAACRLLDRVVLMTFSEFGRTLAENGRRGTDHGSAAPVFLAGGKLVGGFVGKHPDISKPIAGGGIQYHTDFRRIYAALLDPWLGLDSKAILGKPFEPLGIFA